MNRRHGFTLIELLVILAILGVLIGLLLPAVQKARDAANRTKCSNNLRQIGLALQMYHDSVHTFPSGMRYRDGMDPYPLMTWLTQLLPYLEQENAWANTQRAYQQSRRPFDNPPHTCLNTMMPVFLCPSDVQGAQVRLAPRDGFQVAFTSYLGVEGRDLVSRDGVLYCDSHVRMADITDGTSQTLTIGERPASADFQYGWWYAGAGQQFTGSGDSVLGVEELNVLPYALAPCAPGRYTYSSGKTTSQCDLFHFWSLHNGGANFAFADGSVHFLNYSASSILPALASRAGGEVALPSVDRVHCQGT